MKRRNRNCRRIGWRFAYHCRWLRPVVGLVSALFGFYCISYFPYCFESFDGFLADETVLIGASLPFEAFHQFFEGYFSQQVFDKLGFDIIVGDGTYDYVVICVAGFAVFLDELCPFESVAVEALDAEGSVCEGSLIRLEFCYHLDLGF